MNENLGDYDPFRMEDRSRSNSNWTTMKTMTDNGRKPSIAREGSAHKRRDSNSQTNLN